MKHEPYLLLMIEHWHKFGSSVYLDVIPNSQEALVNVDYDEIVKKFNICFEPEKDETLSHSIAELPPGYKIVKDEQ